MKRRRIKRNIAIKGQETAAERQTRTAVRFVMDNKHYKEVLAAIRAGTPLNKIAEAGIHRGWFDVNQKTVVGYLQYFRRAQPNLCKPEKPREDGEDDINRLFDPGAAIVDEETELVRLIQLQKARIGLGFRNEREINVLIQSNRREVEELRNLLIDLAKLRGHLNNSMDVNLNSYTESVRDDLKGIQQDEQQRNMIATLVSDLVGVQSSG